MTDKNLLIRSSNRRITGLLIARDVHITEIDGLRECMKNALIVIDEGGFTEHIWNGQDEVPVFVTDKARVLEYIKWCLDY